MRDTILYDSAMRLFGDQVTPQLLAAAETGAWPEALWQTVTEAGYLDVLAEGPAGMVEAATILRAAGHHAAPLPLVETMLARWLYSATRLIPPDGPLGIVGATPGREGTVVPWGRNTMGIVIVGQGEVCFANGCEFEQRSNLAGEPRDWLRDPGDASCVPMPAGIDGSRVLGLAAVLRAAQMAGAMEAVLVLSVRYANDRVQFGRPIGKFQAIQQQLAVLAEEVAAALVVSESAALAVAEARPAAELGIAAAKIRAGEAAGRVAEIAHQVHGAIGFTEEHFLHFLTRRLWSWRDEYGDEAYWAEQLGGRVAAAGGIALWPLITA